IHVSFYSFFYAYCFFFFFQAEDGIRDATVTGVQTCALPISQRRDASPRCARNHRAHRGLASRLCAARQRFEDTAGVASGSPRARSEERRVGKECRARRWKEHEKNKEK